MDNQSNKSSQYQYSANEIEKKWQSLWLMGGVFNNVCVNENRPKYYVLSMFPYPSGKLHMGHVRNYTLGDIVARFKFLQGYNVLQPIGWDSFGLPAENAAVQNQIHPKQWTEDNIQKMKLELKSLGFAYDWSKEISTCSPEYYRYEQEMFLAFFKEGIAYQAEAVVNWDPVDQTVLANEQVINGRGWRSGALVEARKLKQWFLSIKDFADDLLQGLRGDEMFNWPQKVKVMQEKWIGRSEGANIYFEILDTIDAYGNSDIDRQFILEMISKVSRIQVFSTKPETIFGAAFIGISVEHEIALSLQKKEREGGVDSGLELFIKQCRESNDTEINNLKAEKLGYKTGLYVKHPFDKDRKLPIYILNFVLPGYGTDAIFGCPAHDQRDYDFAMKYEIPFQVVITPGIALVNNKEAGEEGRNLPFLEDGVMCNSDFLNNMKSGEAKKYIIQKLEEKNLGSAAHSYRLKDWGISRQRYWGCPIPIIHCKDCGAVPVNSEDLPILLPEDVDFTSGGNPLEKNVEWKRVACPKCGNEAERELDTFDTFIESSWYFGRFISLAGENKAFDKDAVNYWLPVDVYIGGIEHAVMHLLYARFFTRALKKVGYWNLDEPFKKLVTQGMVCHQSYKDSKGNWVSPEDIVYEDGGQKLFRKDNGDAVRICGIEKMSKSKQNTVTPSSMLKKYGADAIRLFVVSNSPPDRDVEWNEVGIDSTYKYLSKLYSFVLETLNHNQIVRSEKGVKQKMDPVLELQSDFKEDSQRDTNILLGIHQAIQDVTNYYERMEFNKAVASLRILNNVINQNQEAKKQNILIGLKILLVLFYPIIPHFSEDLWFVINDANDHDNGNDQIVNEVNLLRSIANVKWPKANPQYLRKEDVKIAVQVNGKLKEVVEVRKTSSREEVINIAKDREKISKIIGAKEIRKVIYVQGKVVNFIVKL